MKTVIGLIVGGAFATFSSLSYAHTSTNAAITANYAVKNKTSVAIPAATTKPNFLVNFFTGKLSGNFDLTTNYMYRGISLSNNDPAVQGGLTYSLKTTGIYINIWGSNVDFLDPQGRTATVELDTNVGIVNPIGDNFSYDISLNRYNYPKAGGANYNELTAIANYRFIIATIAYSPNVYNLHKSGTYYEIGLTYDVPSKYIQFEGINVQASVGHYSLPRNVGLFSYNNYSATINKKLSNYVISLGWIDAEARAHQGTLGGSHVVATVTANF